MYSTTKIETHILPDETLPVVRQTPQRQKSDSSNPIQKFGGLAGLAARKRRQH